MVDRGIEKLIDLDAGWRTVRRDIDGDRAFFRHPYQRELIELDLVGWLGRIRQELADGTYEPDPMTICECPKGGNAVRPGSVLGLDDAVVFTALVEAAFEPAAGAVELDPRRDYAYRPRAQRSPGSLWFEPSFRCWENFNRASLARIDAGAQFAVVADVAGCYEHVDLFMLASDLRTAGVPEPIVRGLSQVLNAWPQVDGRGLPQGMSASDLLAKVYLTPIDQHLTSLGYDHVRYVDDFRLFCPDLPTSKRAVVELTRALRWRGLSLQTAKLQILREDKARDRFNGVRPIVSNVAKRYTADIVRFLGIDNPYLTMAEAEDMVTDIPLDDLPTETLRQVFNTHFVDDPAQFSGTLFRFLLNRLGARSDRHVVPFVAGLLREHPEETARVLQYVSRCDAFELVDDVTSEFLRSPYAVYDYQRYQIFEARWRHPRPPSEDFTKVARETAFDVACPAYVRSVARRCVAQWGTSADWSRAESSLAAESTDLGQAEIICMTANMEVVRRNSFIAKAGRRGDYQARAERWVKSQ